MGNKKSSNSEVTKDESAAPAAYDDVSAPTSEEEEAVVIAPTIPIVKLSIKDLETKEHSSAKNARRIVKATHPKKARSMENVAIVTTTDNHDIFDDVDDFQKVETNKKQQPVWESPSVAREIEQEKADSQKQARVKTAEDRQRLTREKKLHDRRLASPVAKAKKVAPGDINSTASERKANPMSRFLSAFSVDSHPEHKRRAAAVITGAVSGGGGGGGDDDDATKKPDEKRHRPSVTDEQEAIKGVGADYHDDDDDGNFKSNRPPNDDDVDVSIWRQQPATILAASAVAVAAILVGIAVLRWNKCRY